MHLIIIILFAITVLLAFFEDRIRERDKAFILMGYFVFMVFLASTKSLEHTADALIYENMFYKNDDFMIALITEPTFLYISRIILAMGGTVSVLFFIYAVISIPGKMLSLYRMTPYIFTALLIYIPVYFELHDLIQIRASAATMFLLASMIPLTKGRYIKATALVVAGIFFHYSAAAFLPFLIIGNRKLNTIGRGIICILIPFCFGMYLLKKDWSSLIPTFGSTIGYKIEGYKESAAKGKWDEFYPLYANLYYLSKCAMLYLCMYYYDYLTQKHRMAPLLINLFAASTLFLTSMATIPVIASRISDLYGITDCIVFTFLLYLIEPKYWARIAITIIGFYMIVYNILFTEYFT